MPKDLATAPGSGGDCPVQYGAICWRMHRGRVEVLLITSRDTGRWVIPKGWPMQGLSAAAAAGREAWEEAGVQGTPEEDGLGAFSYDKVLKPGDAVRCRVQVFALRVGGLKDKYPERRMRRRKWFDHEKAARKVAEPELRGLLMALPDLLDQPSAEADA
ncbi:MAG: NUDIX hydrolase [Rhodobacteraceae bacterium]|nr:NUDIX hydrolase [Paracoccaceae bacterium]